jgi:hypothetical protein
VTEVTFWRYTVYLKVPSTFWNARQIGKYYTVCWLFQGVYEIGLFNVPVARNLSEYRKVVQPKLQQKIQELDDHYHKQYRLNQFREGWGLLNSMYFCGTVFTTIGEYAKHLKKRAVVVLSLNSS